MKSPKYDKPAKLNLSVVERLQKALNDNIRPEFKERKNDGKKGFNKTKKQKQPFNRST